MESDSWTNDSVKTFSISALHMTWFDHAPFESLQKMPFIHDRLNTKGLASFAYCYLLIAPKHQWYLWILNTKINIYVNMYVYTQKYDWWRLVSSIIFWMKVLCVCHNNNNNKKSIFSVRQISNFACISQENTPIYPWEHFTAGPSTHCCISCLASIHSGSFLIMNCQIIRSVSSSNRKQ